jgi:hypothetical protein
MESAKIFRLNAQQTTTNQAAAPSANSSGLPQKPKLLDQVRQAIRTRRYSDKTEKAYVHWIKRYIFFHNKRHPLEMSEPRDRQIPFKSRDSWARQRLDTKPGLQCAIVSLSRDAAQKDRIDRWRRASEAAAPIAGGAD